MATILFKMSAIKKIKCKIRYYGEIYCIGVHGKHIDCSLHVDSNSLDDLFKWSKETIKYNFPDEVKKGTRFIIKNIRRHMDEEIFLNDLSLVF